MLRTKLMHPVQLGRPRPVGVLTRMCIPEACCKQQAGCLCTRTRQLLVGSKACVAMYAPVSLTSHKTTCSSRCVTQMCPSTQCWTLYAYNNVSDGKYSICDFCTRFVGPPAYSTVTVCQYTPNQCVYSMLNPKGMHYSTLHAYTSCTACNQHVQPNSMCFMYHHIYRAAAW
jgi:hypothetical protein